MAKQMSWTDAENEVTYTESYWRPIQCNFDVLTQTGMVVFGGWKNQAARQRGKRLVGAKIYYITPAIYEQYFKESILKDAGKSFLTQSYLMATETLDTPSGEPAVMKSFFDGALDV